MKFIAGEPMKPATNLLAGRRYSSNGRADLLHEAVLHHDDAIAEGHGLHLVVSDEDGGGRNALPQLL